MVVKKKKSHKSLCFKILAFKKKMYFLIYFWLCWFSAVLCRLFTAVSSPVAGMGSGRTDFGSFRHTGSVVPSCRLSSTGSVVMMHRLSFLTAHGTFPSQGQNPCTIRWILNHWTSRKALLLDFLYLSIYLSIYIQRENLIYYISFLIVKLFLIYAPVDSRVGLYLIRN